MPPLITVVIPAYNVERYVVEAARSAVTQSGVEVEVVVVDDGSDDGTGARARTVPGVRVLEQDNAGVAAARNAGVEASRGDVLCFLDGDDRLRPGGLRAAWEHLAGGADFAFGRATLVDESGEPLPSYRHPVVPRDVLYRELLRGSWVAPAGVLLVRRAAFAAVGGWDASLHNAGEDLDLYLRLARAVAGVDHAALVCDYRVHPGNMSKRYARILQQNVAVLEAQAPYTARDAQLERARRDGIAAQKRVYGTKLALAQLETAAQARSGRGPALAAATRALAAHPVYASRLMKAYVRRARAGS